MFSETSQTEWREPVDFPTGISGFSMEMRNNKLEIRIAGSSCRPQQNVKSKIKQSYKRKSNDQLGEEFVPTGPDACDHINPLHYSCDPCN